MDTPTREKPDIALPGGLNVTRGYELLDPTAGELVFIGAHDGPLLQVRWAGGEFRMSIRGVGDLVAAMTLAASIPAASELPMAEIRELGFAAA